MNSPITPEKILDTVAAFATAKALLTANELGIFTELAKGPLDAQTLTIKLDMQGRGAHDFFDLLVALQLLDRQNDKYSNAPDTDLFLDKNKPSYLGGYLDLLNKRVYPLWGSLTEGLHTGKLQNVMGKKGEFTENTFTVEYADIDEARNFMNGMTGIGKPFTLALTSIFPWQDYKTVLDVGTAQGDTIAQIALAHTHITGIGFDLPPVQQFFDEHITELGLQDHLTFYAGDFFKVAFPSADVIIMGQILHDWNLEQKQLLLKKAYEALPSGGALIVYDSLIDEEHRKNVFALLTNMTMLLDTPGGFNYTGSDCIKWMKTAGFNSMYVKEVFGPFSMVVGFK